MCNRREQNKKKLKYSCVLILIFFGLLLFYISIIWVEFHTSFVHTSVMVMSFFNIGKSAFQTFFGLLFTIDCILNGRTNVIIMFDYINLYIFKNFSFNFHINTYFKSIAPYISWYLCFTIFFFYWNLDFCFYLFNACHFITSRIRFRSDLL